MPPPPDSRALRPGVLAAEDLLALAEAHLDRVHDLCVRLGCTADEAAEITEATAGELIAAVAGARPTEDLLGWWFGRARRMVLQVTAAPADGDDAAAEGPLAGSAEQRRLTAALDRLTEPGVTALLLRDSYGLPLPTLQVALSAAPAVVRSGLAEARSALAQTLSPSALPAAPGHVGADALAGLAEDDRAVPAPTRRHVAGCPACSDQVGRQQQVRAALAGLAVHALPDQARARLLETLAQRTSAALPSRERVRAAVVDAAVAADRPAVPWPVVVLALALAAVLGVAAGVTLSEPRDRTAPGVPVGGPAPTLPRTDPAGGRGESAPDPQDLGLSQPPPSASVEPSAAASEVPPPSASPAAPSRAPAPVPSRAPAPVPAAAPAPPQAPTLALDPPSGPNGTLLTVTGTGFTPGATVRLAYLDRLGQEVSSAVTTAGPDGRVRGRLRASDPSGLPGPHTVRAGDGARGASTTFTATAL